MAERVVRGKSTARPSFDTILRNYQDLIELQKETREPWREKVSVHIDTPLPYLPIHPLSDLHLGHVGVATEILVQHLEFIKRAGVQTIVLGDVIDNFLPTAIPDGMMGDVFIPQLQLEMMQALFQEYKDNILAVVRDPSHVGWAQKKAGLDLYGIAVRGTGIPLLKNGGVLDISVGSERYSILCFHKIDKYNSSLNRLNAHHRARELHKSCDVVISGHRHIGAMEKSVHREEKPYFIQLGTMKLEDQHGEVEGMFPRPQVFFPTLFFDAKRHNIESIEDLGMAEDFVGLMRRSREIQAVAALGLANKKRK